LRLFSQYFVQGQDRIGTMISYAHMKSNDRLFLFNIINKQLFLNLYQNPFLHFAVLFFLSNAFSNAYGETICLNERAPSGYIATSLTQSSKCGSLLRGIPNAMVVRRVRENSDRICLSPLPIPKDYVITRRFYESICGENSDALPNSAEIREAYSGIYICLGPKIPDSYILTRLFYQTSCGGPDRNALSNSAQITKPYSGATSCLHTQIPSGFVSSRILYSPACGNNRLMVDHANILRSVSQLGYTDIICMGSPMPDNYELVQTRYTGDCGTNTLGIHNSLYIRQSAVPPGSDDDQDPPSDSGGGGGAVPPMPNIVGIAYVDSNKMACAWYNNYTVSCGSTFDLNSKRSTYRYTLPAGYTPNDIVDIAWVGSQNMACAWYMNGKVSCGSTRDLDSIRSPYSYSLPPGYSTSDIKGIAWVPSQNMACAWYADSKGSCGTTSDLDRSLGLSAYSLPPGYYTRNIVAVAWVDASNMQCTWYNNWYASCGNGTDMDSVRALYRYSR
jgi:hypothetical protein